MLANLRTHLTYANVMATLAFFLALTGGVAWALDRNSVKSKHIAPAQVKASDIATSAVGADELKSVHVVFGEDATTIDGGVAHNGAYSTGSATAQCPVGEQAISGGATWNSGSTPADAELFLSLSTPTNFVNGADPLAWRVTGGNDSGTDAMLRAVVLCAT